jgi:hypothetical protein
LIDPETRTGTVVLANKPVDVTLLGAMLTRQVRTQSWSASDDDPDPTQGPTSP